MSPECIPEVKNLCASNTFAAEMRKTNILAREVLQKPKMRSATKAPSKKKVNGAEGGNAILVFCNTPWARTAKH